MSVDVKANAPVEKVEALSSEVVYLQLTADVWDFERADFPGKLASLEDISTQSAQLSIERIVTPRMSVQRPGILLTETLFRTPGVFGVLLLAVVLGVILRRHASRARDREAAESPSDVHKREWAYDGLAIVFLLSVSIVAGAILLYFFPTMER